VQIDTIRNQSAIVVGAGLGGLATALRLVKKGFSVTIIEKYHQAGGRLNQLKQDGFTFDIGPSFFSMSYEFEELFNYLDIENPLKFTELDPIYSVYFEGREEPILIHKDVKKLAEAFKPYEKDFENKVQAYLDKAQTIFHDTEYRIIKKNYNGILSYLKALVSVPPKHLPMLFKSMWQELDSTFDSYEAKVVFSLVAFFLGGTPFDTPAVYSLLNYTELRHDGYWHVKGGMYRIVECMVEELNKHNTKFIFNTEIVGYQEKESKLYKIFDVNNNEFSADVFVINGDAASFRGQIFKREKFAPKKLDQLTWTLAPFTIYLGIKGKIENLYHHNYFLGNNFTEYANDIFKTSSAPTKPYYYVNNASKSEKECAPEGCENLFILCPVPDLRTKKDWNDSEELSNTIISDLGNRIGYDLHENIITKTIYTPVEWGDMFNLYKGSGLGLAHGLTQIAGLRPKNKDEEFNNVYYVGASTVPGTGLPIVIISSKLTTERILEDYAAVS
jgi:phytoene desaturase